MLPDYLLMTYLKISRDFGVEAPVFLVILDHFCAHLVHFYEGKTMIVHFHAWHILKLYYFREEICFMYFEVCPVIVWHHYFIDSVHKICIEIGFCKTYILIFPYDVICVYKSNTRSIGVWKKEIRISRCKKTKDTQKEYHFWSVWS